MKTLALIAALSMPMAAFAEEPAPKPVNKVVVVKSKHHSMLWHFKHFFTGHHHANKAVKHDAKAPKK